MRLEVAQVPGGSLSMTFKWESTSNYRFPNKLVNSYLDIVEVTLPVTASVVLQQVSQTFIVTSTLTLYYHLFIT